MNRKDVGSGAFFAAVGLFYGAVAVSTLPIGQALRMGPGYFPLVLSGCLVALGVLIAGRGILGGVEGSPFGVIPWRAVLVLSLATIVFAVLLRHLGLLPTVFLTAWISAMAKEGVGVLRATVAAILISIFCTLVFSYAIGLNVPIFGDWLVG